MRLLSGGMTTWLSSDSHYNHARISEFCGRPYESVNRMNQDLMERWNSVVKPLDTTYHLGDFAFASKAQISEFRRALKGRIVLVRGNHDRSIKAMLECGFDQVVESMRLPRYNLFLRTFRTTISTRTNMQGTSVATSTTSGYPARGTEEAPF